MAQVTKMTAERFVKYMALVVLACKDRLQDYKEFIGLSEKQREKMDTLYANYGQYDQIELTTTNGSVFTATIWTLRDHIEAQFDIERPTMDKSGTKAAQLANKAAFDAYWAKINKALAEYGLVWSEIWSVKAKRRLPVVGLMESAPRRGGGENIDDLESVFKELCEE